MSVAKRIRKKIASSISPIEETETFLWLKILHAGELDHREIETFTYELWKTDHISLGIEADDKTSAFTFTFDRIRNFRMSQRKLRFRSKTNPVFFGFGNISVSNIKISFDQELSQFFLARIVKEDNSVFLKVKEEKKKESSGELTSKLISLESKNTASEKHFDTSKAHTSLSKVENPAYIIKEPEVTDCLSKLKPKIYNVELLSTFENSGSEGPVSSTKLELLDKVLTIKGIGENDLKFKSRPLYSPFEFNPQISTGKLNLYGNLSPWNTKQIKIKLPEFSQPIVTKLSVFYEKDTPSYFGEGNNLETVFGKEINKIIQPNTNLSPAEEQKLFKKLYQFQIDGVKILTTNRNVLFANEPGLGKTTQTIFAIKYLLKKKEIKSTLIVTDDNSTGDIIISEKTGSPFGWYGSLQKFAPELSCNIVKSEFNDIIAELTKPFQVQIISYRLLSTALKSKSFRKEIFKNFKCLVLEDAEYFRNNQNEFVQLINLINPKFSWIITNLEIEGYALNILTALNPETFLSHNYDNVKLQLPEINESEFWVDMDKDHQDEFDGALFHARNSLQNILETGNPFRFQSQLFFYIHQLNQAGNFPSNNIDSNKTNLLLSHISSLRSYNKRVIIFSQYDKAGIQKLARLFKRERINYIKYGQGMTPAELSKAVSEFENDKSITVFLADSQVMKTKSYLVYAPYIIHFDQWWAPVSRWELESKINNKFNEPINILNYFTKSTLDEEIRSILFKKKMLDRNNLKKIGADAFSKILNEDEWSKIFGLEKKVKHPEEKEENENGDENN